MRKEETRSERSQSPDTHGEKSCGTGRGERRRRRRTEPVSLYRARQRATSLLQRLWAPWSDTAQRWENVGAIVLAVAVGLAGGVGAILFRFLIHAAGRLFFDGGGRALTWFGDAYVIVLPATGLVIVSFIVNRWAPEARGHGVPEVMLAMRQRGGRIRPRVTIIKALASALCIGSGGSVGREGPIVQIGSAMGSAVGQWLGLPSRRIRLLVACGSAAAISGTFNAPIGGALFAMEVVLGTLVTRSFALVVISSVTSTALCRAVLGAQPAFSLDRVFALRSLAEYPIYLVVGLAAGLVALAYVQTLYAVEDVFRRWRLHYLAKALLGGLGVGAIGYAGIELVGGPYLFGVGYDGIQQALQLDWQLSGRMTLTVLLLLIGMKTIATSLTLAAGGSGGVFAPALFVGAMMGGALGRAAGALFPGVVASPGAYALVGMAAVFGGAAHAPLTSIVILFEMTDDYQIILPLMIATVISHLVASTIEADNVYTIKVRRRGGLIPAAPEPGVLDLIVAADAMSLDFEKISPDRPLRELTVTLHNSPASSCCVVDEDGRLHGIATEPELERALATAHINGKTVRDIMIRNPITVTPEQRLREVLALVAEHGLEQVPVVARDDATTVRGVLRQRELMWAYGQLATELDRTRKDRSQSILTEPPGLFQTNLTVCHDSPLAFTRIREVAFPKCSRVAMVHRADRHLIPTGSTKIEPGDVLTMVAPRDHEHRLRQWKQEMAAS